MNDLGQFVNLVAEMRQRQRDWFRNHRKEDLHAAKNLERVVDTHIKNLRDKAAAEETFFESEAQ